MVSNNYAIDANPEKSLNLRPSEEVISIKKIKNNIFDSLS
jgi:hypothetical protein